MLVLTRRQGESIDIGDDTQIEVILIRGSTVRLGLRGPDSVRFVRSELKGRDESSGESTVRNAKPAA